MARHCGVGGNQSRAGRASEEVATRVGLDSNKLTRMRRLKDRRQHLLIRVLPPDRRSRLQDLISAKNS